MAYVADHARKWSPRRRAKVIERSVDRALAEVAEFGAAKAADRKALIARARAAVEALPQSHFAEIGAKHGLTGDQAKTMLLKAAGAHPELSLRSTANTLRKLEAA